MAAGITKLDVIRNEYIRGNLIIRDIGHKIEVERMRWLGLIVRRDEDDITNKIRQSKIGRKG